MENILFCKAEISHSLGSEIVTREPIDRRASNFEAASNNVAGPQLWSNPTRKTLVAVASKTDMSYHNLVCSLADLWGQNAVSMVEETNWVVCTKPGHPLAADMFEPMTLLCSNIHEGGILGGLLGGSFGKTSKKTIPIFGNIIRSPLTDRC
ncbi:hypothetical protein PHYBLDRAFT_73920 [Phycomyces blakesleeanus NRRL 1555(-)]|uniref:Uncharacterized protein n=1 Tax=Phycomyces blakesleeanus (strain ATCC 8743b / DSM 1359 / FGSC 10004 / NBRC 33097 / NRRL 1555) TaxID=763407 RepID=A0A162TNH8_PHYB8|nr:hypothetical protein PHYBLDRAFT_73920 [Phycomyces blakesleeanus NRRL 1555(-)]OAD68563.1 hypothetical protein PHYBLDRAFT_73920 [Phycomyces blakesleeanus NRRL 1555(-)]|eukprot:XP_018286603.1 hypothetical protein PHYBLDRAFT_73920 [Phycomyces blakesleeanus NRRL 1555(-)]